LVQGDNSGSCKHRRNIQLRELKEMGMDRGGDWKGGEPKRKEDRGGQ